MKWHTQKQIKNIIGRRLLKMRMFRKKYENAEKAVYEYLCEDYKLPYTGIIEINKATLDTVVVKPAENEWNEQKAIMVARFSLPERNYPKTLTHTAV